MRGARAGLFVKLADATVKLQKGCARVALRDFDVLPRDAARPARLEGFEHGFLGSEARGVMLGGNGSATVAIGALARRENALDEARRARDDFAHATDFDDVYTD